MTSMKRRDFLRLGGAGVVAFAAASPASARPLLGPPSLRVAWRPSWQTADTDATRLVRGDADLERVGARLTVFGLVPEAEGCSGHVGLDVHFAQAGRHARFHAWSRVDPEVCGEPGAASFVAPLDPQGRLTIEPIWDGVGIPVTLTARAERGRPRLRAGVYLFSAVRGPRIVATVTRADRIGPLLPPWRIQDAARPLHR